MLPLDISVMEQNVLPGQAFPTAASAVPGRVCLRNLGCTCLSTRAFVLYLDVYCMCLSTSCAWTCLFTRACAAPVYVCLFFVPHLWTCLFSVYKSLCCTCTCLPARAFVLPQDMSFYMKSPCYPSGVRSTTVFFRIVWKQNRSRIHRSLTRG
jgi:hypothetical protein